MALTITSNFSAVADSTLTMLNKHQSVMGKTIEKVSSGMKINHSKDNSVQFAKAQKLNADVDSMGVVNENLQGTSAYLNSLDSAVTSIIDKLTQMREKALEWGSGTVDESSEEKTNITTALNKLSTDIDNIVTKTKYNQKELMNYDKAKTLNLVNDPFEFNANLTVEVDALTNLKAMSNTISASETALTAVKSGGSIYKALSEMRNVQADIGLGMQRLEDTVSFISELRSAAEDGISTIKEADMAKEMTTYVKQNVLAQASQAMLAQANSGYASVLNLLQ